MKAEKLPIPKRHRGGTSNLVLKLSPDHWLLADVLVGKDSKPYLKRLVTHPLPRQVDPNRPNLDLELLQESLTSLVEAEGLVGRDISLILPSSGSVTHSHQVAFDLTDKADLKEFRLGAEDKEFWQEFEPEIQDAKLPVFRYQYMAAGEEPSTSQVYFSWGDQLVLKRYLDMCLNARLYPVALIPETEAILNLLLPSVDRLEREGYFGLLHLARGRSHLLAVGPERIVSAKVNINELDEELLDEIESLTDIKGEFWEEVGARMASALRQAVMYLREQEKIPVFRSIYVICEMPKCDNTLELIREHFNLGNLKNWHPLANQPMDLPRVLPAVEAIPNQAAWASLIGGGLLGLRDPKLIVAASEMPRFQLNLHPQQKRLVLNRKLRKIGKRVNWASMVLGSIFLSWLLADIGPRYYALVREAESSRSVLSELEQARRSLDGTSAAVQASLAQVALLQKAAAEDKRSRLLVALPSVLPVGTELSRLEIDGAMVSLVGHAFEPAGPQRFLNQIVTSKILLSPTLEVTQAKDAGDVAILNFRITGAPGVIN